MKANTYIVRYDDANYSGLRRDKPISTEEFIKTEKPTSKDWAYLIDGGWLHKKNKTYKIEVSVGFITEN
jgi:predicted small secreted protein